VSEFLCGVAGVIIGAVIMAVSISGTMESVVKRGFMTVDGRLYSVTPAKPTVAP
jgi:hypothetical protein